jgi:type IV pilus assembly protein PilM
MIREKKPWAVALVALLLLGCAASFFGHWRAWNSVDLKKFDSALNQAKSAEGIASSGKSAYETALNDFKSTSQIGEGLVGNVDGRLLWLEMMTALSQCLPKDESRPEEIMDRNEVHISELQCEWQADLGTWYQAGVADKIKEMQASMMPADPAVPALPPDGAPAPEGAAPANPDAAAPDAQAPGAAPADPAAAATPPPEDTGPKGPGWVIQLRGEHYHNKQSQDSAYVQGSAYVRDTLVKNLREKEIVLPGKDGKPEKMPLKELGIGYPVIVETSGKILDETLTDAERNTTSVRKFTFVVQFAWSPTPISKRIEARQQKASGQAPALADSPAGGP